MLLSIDAEKVKDQLQKDRPTYVATPCNLEMAAITGSVQTSVISVVSTVTTVPPDVEHARARLLKLRQSLIEKGFQPLSGEDLDRTIAEIRGR